MCNKSSNIIRQRRATSKAAAGSCSGLKSSARKTRTKKRKPKYLSLIKLELSPRKKKQVNPQEATNSKNKVPHTTKQQLVSNLILQDGSSDMQDDHVAAAFLFQTATEDASTTLQDLLDTTTTTASSTTTTAATSEDGPLSPSLTFVSTRPRYDVRAAMRRKERDASGERWVSYCEVVKTEQEEEESSSCGGGYMGDGRRGGCGGGDSSGNMMEVQDHGDQKRLVGLKLDYEDILNAWSDKGPLYIQGEGELPLTVPDLHDGSNGLIDGLGHLGGLWTVPEMDGMKMTENVGGADHGRKLAGQREASVLRYKEKRQSRLFSKRIRYEVRKLNAEKRPRLKGRFVKRSGEA